MNKIPILLLFSLLVILVKPSAGQTQDSIENAAQIDRALNISVLNLRPVPLKKREMLFSFQAEFPKFYKTYNPKSGKTDKVPETTVLNEAYYYGHLIYGLSDRFNLIASLPFSSVHHYTPTSTISGKGLGDIKLGGNYSLIDLENNGNSLNSGITIAFPTGKSKNLNPNDFPIGLGVFSTKGDITGFHHFKSFDLVYSIYYEYRNSTSDRLNVGDQTGAFLTLQKQINTSYGNFGLEGGAYAYWNFKDRKNGTLIPHTDDYATNLYVGGYYNYLKNFYIRFGLPYTIYQNKSWLTKYEVLLQLDYHFVLNRKK